VDDEARPYRMEKTILSDPGHALEFVGFALKFFDVARRSGALTAKQEDEMQQAQSTLQSILQRNFENGFNRSVGGIVKSYDLVGRRPINGDMPWWNLPETMRAAALAAEI